MMVNVPTSAVTRTSSFFTSGNSALIRYSVASSLISTAGDHSVAAATAGVPSGGWVEARPGFFKGAKCFMAFMIIAPHHGGTSDRFGFHHQQYDSADERQRADHGRDEMIVGGLNVYAQEVHRLARRFERDARISEHDDSQCDEDYCGDGFS